eukprot:4678395-Pleurochrysis_carterae.AAC.1
MAAQQEFSHVSASSQDETQKGEQHRIRNNNRSKAKRVACEQLEQDEEITRHGRFFGTNTEDKRSGDAQTEINWQQGSNEQSTRQTCAYGRQRREEGSGKEDVVWD